jgi:RNA polymerase sigma-70 factor (ECF subfamily)
MTEIEFQYRLINLQENLMRFAYKLTSDKEDAKDLVQDTFLKALKYCDKFVYESNLKAWTYTIMKNTFVNSYRRSVKQNTYSDQTKEGFCLNYTYASGSFYPDSEYTSKELGKIIEALNDDFKLPFKMHHEGFKYKEIAETLDLRLGTVKSRIFFARKQLMNQLNG